MIREVKVSIIMPVYNSEKYLFDSLQSACEQTMKELEIICVNDGSKDSSVAIIKKFLKKDMRVRLTGSETINRGQAYARNLGLKMSQGEYIYFMDADDLLLSDSAMQDLYEKAIAEDLECIVFDADSEQPSKKETGKFVYQKSCFGVLTNHLYEGKEFFISCCSMGNYSTVVWRQFWKKGYLTRNHISFYEDTSPHEDLLFSFQAFFLCQRMKYFNYILYRYRWRDDSSSRGIVQKKNLYAHVRCYCETMNFLMRHHINYATIPAYMRHIEYIKRVIRMQGRELIKQGIDVNEMAFPHQTEKDAMNILLKEDYAYLNAPLSADQYQLLTNHEHIIIYGIGTVGKEALVMLLRYGFSNIFFAVTQKETSDQKFLSANVYSISELAEYKESSVVFVAASKKYKEEMINNLERIGYTQYISLC